VPGADPCAGASLLPSAGTVAPGVRTGSGAGARAVAEGHGEGIGGSDNGLNTGTAPSGGASTGIVKTGASRTGAVSAEAKGRVGTAVTEGARGSRVASAGASVPPPSAAGEGKEVDMGVCAGAATALLL
jgi:hypothetical protein